jgi:hypothetical protein
MIVLGHRGAAVPVLLKRRDFVRDLFTKRIIIEIRRIRTLRSIYAH